MGNLLSASWLDPANGSYSTIKGSPFNNKGELTLSQDGVNSRGEKDWVLIISTAK